MRRSIPEVANPSLTPSGECGVSHASQWRDFVIANVTLGEKNSEATASPCCTNQGPKQLMHCYCQHKDYGPNARRIYRKPLTVRAWRIITTAKVRERMGAVLEVTSRQYTGGVQREHISKTSWLLSILSLDPVPHGRHSPLVVSQAVRRGLRRDPGTPLCLRLLGWGGGQ